MLNILIMMRINVIILFITVFVTIYNFLHFFRSPRLNIGYRDIIA